MTRGERDLRREIERSGGRVLEITGEGKKHRLVRFLDQEGKERGTTLNHGRSYPAPELRRVLRQTRNKPRG